MSPSAIALRSVSSTAILSSAIVVSFRVVGFSVQRREDDAVAVLVHGPRCYTKSGDMTQYGGTLTRRIPPGRRANERAGGYVRQASTRPCTAHCQLHPVTDDRGSIHGFHPVGRAWDAPGRARAGAGRAAETAGRSLGAGTVPPRRPAATKPMGGSYPKGNQLASLRHGDIRADWREILGEAVASAAVRPEPQPGNVPCSTTSPSAPSPPSSPSPPWPSRPGTTAAESSRSQPRPDPRPPARAAGPPGPRPLHSRGGPALAA